MINYSENFFKSELNEDTVVISNFFKIYFIQFKNLKFPQLAPGNSKKYYSDTNPFSSNYQQDSQVDAEVIQKGGPLW